MIALIAAQRITILVGILVGALAGFVSLDALADLTSIGTLFAFMLVSIAVVILRRRRPDLPRALRCRSRRCSRCWRASPRC